MKVQKYELHKTERLHKTQFRKKSCNSLPSKSPSALQTQANNLLIENNKGLKGQLISECPFEILDFPKIQ